MAAPLTFVPDETSDEQPSFSAPASFVPDEPSQAPAATFGDPAETIAPLSRWKSLKFGTEQALEKVFPGMAEKSSPSPVAVASQVGMIAPLGLPERLGKLLMGYFTARTAYDQPAIARQIRDEVKQGDLPAAKRTAIEDLLNVGMVGTGIMGLRGGKQPAAEIEPAIAAAPLKMPEGAKPATFIPETPQPIGGQNARDITSATSVLEPEIRSRVGSQTPLRQPGTPAGTQEPLVERPPQGGARADEGAAPPVEPVTPVLKPALLIDGRPVTGGNSHAEILQNLMKQSDLPIDTLDAAVMALEDDSKHVFVDQNGKVYDRTQAAKALGRTGKLQSEDLAKLETKPPVKPAPPSPTPATTPPAGEAVSRGAILHLDYSPEDLAKYQTLRASMKKMSDAGQIMVGEKPNQTFNPEWQRLNIEIEKVRNKYNGNPPKQLVKQATPSPTPSETPTAPVAPSGTPVGERQPAAAAKIQWLKTPSVSPGGKPHFWNAYTDEAGKGIPTARVVWNRATEKWEVSDPNQLDKNGRSKTLASFDKEADAKAFVEKPAAPANKPVISQNEPEIKPSVVKPAAPAQEGGEPTFEQWRDTTSFSPPSNKGEPLNELESKLIARAASDSVQDIPEAKTGQQPTPKHVELLNKWWPWLRTEAGYKWAMDSGAIKTPEPIRGTEQTSKPAGQIAPSSPSPKPAQAQEGVKPENGGRVTLSGGDKFHSDVSGTVYQVHNDGAVLDVVKDGTDYPVRVTVNDYKNKSFEPFKAEPKPTVQATTKPKVGMSLEEAKAHLNRPGQIMGYDEQSIIDAQQKKGQPATPPSVVKPEGKAGKIVITQKPVRKVETADMSASANEISVTLPDGKVYEGFRSRDKGGDWRLSGLKGGFQVRGKTAAEFRANVQKSFDAGEFEHQQPPPAETPAIEPVAAEVKEPSIPPPELKETRPTIKSPLSAFGKQFYKNTAGEWRQKGRPSEKINASRVNALEQLLKPKITSMGGLAPGDPTEPVGKGFVDYGTTGAGQDIYGVAERVRKARAQAGQVAPVPTGQGISDVEAVKWGQELERSGADAEKSMREFERTKAISFDSMALARGHGETLARAARIIESRGTDTPEYRAAQKTLSDWDTRSKAMQTEWHKIGMAQQGETDIDTGSFTGINRAYREVTGEDLPATHVKTAKGIIKGVKDADSAVEKAKPVLQTAIEGISEKGRPVKVPADLDSQQKEFQDYKSGKPMTPLQVKTLWTRAKTEYIDKGNTNFGDTVHKLADDLGLEPKDVLNGLSQTKQVKRIADDVWKKQRQARMLKQAAKRWIEHAQETWMQKALPTVARTMFSMKVGLHGTVALGTHAPLVAATHPTIFKNNFGKMYKLVASPEYYQMQTAEMTRRPNYTVAQRNGLVNDMSKMEDFNDPQLAQGFPKMAAWFKDKLDRVHLGRLSGMGTRGYSVLKILRQDLFDHEWNKLPESMKSDSMAKAIADSVNHITGVTKAGAGQLGKVASYALFAPKLEASRVAVLVTDPIRAANSLIKMDNMTDAEKWFAKNQFKQAAKIFAVGTSLMLANQQLNDLFGDGKKLNGVPVALGGGGWNPMQSDFMKFRVAGMNFAWGSPFLTMARLPLRLYQIGAGSGGKTRFLIYPDESMYKTTGSYLRTQASPFLSPIISVITKGDYQDRPLPQIPGYGPPPPVPKRLAAQGVKPYTWTEFISDTMLPIPVEQAVNEVWHDHGLTRTQAQDKSAVKPFITFIVTAGTGGRLTEDWTPKKSPLSE